VTDQHSQQITTPLFAALSTAIDAQASPDIVFSEQLWLISSQRASTSAHVSISSKAVAEVDGQLTVSSHNHTGSWPSFDLPQQDFYITMNFVTDTGLTDVGVTCHSLLQG
jgi:hypothetical protein